MRIDLHTHSNRSDGTDTPTELVENAKAAGLDVVALTDHDTTVGWDEAEVAAERIGIRLVKGIEISSSIDHKSVHLLGYDFDPTDEPLLKELGKVLDGRNGRVPKIVAAFERIGIDITEEEIVAKSGGAEATGRPHVADVLIDKGVVADRGEAFDNYLSPGKPGYVGRYAAATEEAIRLIKSAGGKAVLAHPWSRGSDSVLTAERIAELVELGLDGLEVDHADHTDDDRESLLKIAGDLDLVVTGSSDYHGTGKGPEFGLGTSTTHPDQLERLLGT
ncbi:PHP domain-containing protein [Aeromicrobium sp.]|uniref:PHP domain-containing protein n=1 Tax=Aeromicrobium sp. TaxID=1871063 RepID=UPI003D6AD07D